MSTTLWPTSKDFNLHLADDVLDSYATLKEICPDHPLLRYLSKVAHSGFEANESFMRVYGEQRNYQNEPWLNTKSLTAYFDDLVDTIDAFYARR